MPRKPFQKKRPGRPPAGGKGPRFAARGRPAQRPPRPPATTAPSTSDVPNGDRLQKVLAAAGLGSRRECEQLIVEGRIEVDGQVVNELGARVDRSRQDIRVDGEPLARPKLVYYAIHKPEGVVTTARDPAGRPRVIDLLPPGAGRVFTVGRLDLASEGLILATNDGELANQLTHPRHGVHKTYEVQVAGFPDPDVLAQLRRGVHLAEGYAHAVHVRMKAKRKRSSILEMVLDEGRNREVRRLFARVGHKVQRLTRIAVGPIRLGDLPRGAVRKLSPEEVRKLKIAAAAGPTPVPGRPDGPTRPVPARHQTSAAKPVKKPVTKRVEKPVPQRGEKRVTPRVQTRVASETPYDEQPSRRTIVGEVVEGEPKRAQGTGIRRPPRRPPKRRKR